MVRGVRPPCRTRDLFCKSMSIWVDHGFVYHQIIAMFIFLKSPNISVPFIASVSMEPMRISQRTGDLTIYFRPAGCCTANRRLLSVFPKQFTLQNSAVLSICLRGRARLGSLDGRAKESISRLGSSTIHRLSYATAKKIRLEKGSIRKCTVFWLDVS